MCWLAWIVFLLLDMLGDIQTDESLCFQWHVMPWYLCVFFYVCGWMDVCVDVEVIDHLTELCLPCLVDNENVI